MEQTLTNFKKGKKYFTFCINDKWVVSAAEKISSVETFQKALFNIQNLELLYNVVWNDLSFSEREDVLKTALEIERKFTVLFDNQERL